MVGAQPVAGCSGWDVGPKLERHHVVVTVEESPFEASVHIGEARSISVHLGIQEPDGNLNEARKPFVGRHFKVSTNVLIIYPGLNIWQAVRLRVVDDGLSPADEDIMSHTAVGEQKVTAVTLVGIPGAAVATRA